MRIFLQGAVIVVVLSLGSLVAAGVYAVLGPQVLRMEEGPMKLLAVITVGLLAIGCAILFIQGALRAIQDHLQYGRGRRHG